MRGLGQSPKVLKALVRAMCVIVIRRTGGALFRAARWLLADAAILALAYAGLGRATAACSAALVCAVTFLLWKSLPGNTVIDRGSRTVLVRENGWGTRRVPFDDIEGIRAVVDGAKAGYCLSLRGGAPAGLMITDMLEEGDAYRREFSLQLLPRIEEMLKTAGSAHTRQGALPPAPLS